jgi:hypothetical protein
MIAISRLLHAVLIVLTGLAVAGAAEPDTPVVPHDVIQLFNGKDLSGWTTWLVDTKRQDPRGVYSVRDGMLRISGDGFGYLSTDKSYQHYRLAAVYLVGNALPYSRISQMTSPVLAPICDNTLKTRYFTQFMPRRHRRTLWVTRKRTICGSVLTAA